MPARVSPTEAVRAEIDGLFGSGRDGAEVLEEVMRLSARLVLQQVLEEEVTSWLGRGWNSRAEAERAGQRNGFSDVTVKTTAGPVSLKRPKLRNTAEAFASQLLGRGVVRTEPLEALVVSGGGAGPVRPRHRGPVGGGAGPRGRVVEVHRVADLRAAARRLRGVPLQGPHRRRVGLPVR